MQITALMSKCDYYRELEMDCLEFCKTYIAIFLDCFCPNVKEQLAPTLNKMNRLAVTDYQWLEALSRNQSIFRITMQYIFEGNSETAVLVVIQILFTIIAFVLYHHFFHN